jgi:hypothetical protein
MDTGQCLAMCKDQSGCRNGYRCVGASSGSSILVTGSCQPLPKTDTLGNGASGAACARDADCKGGHCAAESPLGGVFPGNYCTGTCDGNADCGDGGACLLLTGGTRAGQCFQACSTDADCARDQYRCRELNDGFNACYPAPPPLADNTAGSACAGDADCGGTLGSCATRLPFIDYFTDSEGPAPGGYCTEPCLLHSDCGAGGLCISRGMMGGLCLASCTSMTDCRAGYTCRVLSYRKDNAQVCVLTVTP